MKRVTIRDVAARAEVSPSTVSHALSGRRSISESTRQRVLAAVQALNYGADPIAASLRRGRTGLIGLVLRPKDAVRGSLGGTDNFLRLIGAAATTALDRQWGLVHIPNTVGDCTISLPVDGYLVAHPYANDPVLGQLRRTRLPVVTIDALPDDEEPAWNVTIDYAAGVAEMLAEADVSSAARTALISGTERNRWNVVIGDAVAAWAGGQDALQSVNELYEGEGAKGAERLTDSLLESGVNRILTGPSRFAVGVARAACRAGRAIPQDLEVMSFTDSTMAAAHNPGITTLDICLEKAGAAGVDLLIERLSGVNRQTAPPSIRPAPRWRDSTQ